MSSGSSLQAAQRPGAEAAARPARARPSARRSLAAGALFAFVWLYAAPHYPEINNPNENVRLYMTAALVEEGGYEISRFRARWGWVNDAACVDHAPPEDAPTTAEAAAGTTPGGREASGGAEARTTLAACTGRVQAGHHRRYYSVKAPLASWLATPGYAIARALRGDAPMRRDDGLWWSRLFASGLPMLAFLVFFYGWLGARVRSALVRDAAFVALAFGSVLLGYAYLLASHSTSAAAAFTSFALLYDAHRPRAGTSRRMGTLLRSALAGLLATATTALEYPCFFVTLGLSLYALVALTREGWRRGLAHLAAFGVGALGPVLLVMHFQASAFGSPFTPGHLFVETEGLRAGHESGFFGADAFRWDAAWKLLVHPRLGLFATTPFFLFAPFGVWVAWRRQRLAALVALLSLATTYLVICLMNNWEGGWVLGPRYLVVTLPFVAVAAALALDALAQRRRRLAHSLALGGAGASLVAGGLPSVLYPHVPPEIDWPLPHLAAPLLELGLVPPNLGQLVAPWAGALTLLPLALLALVMLVWAAQRARDVRLWALSAAFGVALVLPQTSLAPRPTDAAERAFVFVRDHWAPPAARAFWRVE